MVGAAGVHQGGGATMGGERRVAWPPFTDGMPARWPTEGGGGTCGSGRVEEVSRVVGQRRTVWRGGDGGGEGGRGGNFMAGGERAKRRGRGSHLGRHVEEKGGGGPDDAVEGGGLAGGKTEPRRCRVRRLEHVPARLGVNRGGGAADGWGHLA
jgi:hypothetical protein